MVVNVPTGNDKIRNLSQVVNDLSLAFQLHKEFEISTLSEGPCLEHVGLYQLLDYLCAVYKFDKKLITISTANFCESHHEYCIARKFNYWILEKSRQNISKLNYSPKKFNGNFRHFGHFIGHGNLYRLQLGSYLFNHHADQTIQTYHYQVGVDYHREFIGIEDMIHFGKSADEIDKAIMFLRQCPLKLDAVPSYPILQPNNIDIGRYYHSFMIEIVNQTYFSGKIFYLDEKIWRPMLLKTPFMVQGSKNFIKNLQKIGFKTFEKYWREDYSLDPDNCQTEAMIENISNLSNLSIEQLQDMYNEMKDILEHNFDLAMSLSPDQIETISFDS